MVEDRVAHLLQVAVEDSITRSGSSGSANAGEAAQVAEQDRALDAARRRGAGRRRPARAPRRRPAPARSGAKVSRSRLALAELGAVVDGERAEHATARARAPGRRPAAIVPPLKASWATHRHRRPPAAIAARQPAQSAQPQRRRGRDERRAARSGAVDGQRAEAQREAVAGSWRSRSPGSPGPTSRRRRWSRSRGRPGATGPRRRPRRSCRGTRGRNLARAARGEKGTVGTVPGGPGKSIQAPSTRELRAIDLLTHRARPRRPGAWPTRDGERQTPDHAARVDAVVRALPPRPRGRRAQVGIPAEHVGAAVRSGLGRAEHDSVRARATAS